MPFTPRLTSAGMEGSPWWYSSGNPFYSAGYGLPNCTCYAYGRVGEIRGSFAPLPTGNGGQWYAAATGFQRGSRPALGAVACYKSRSGTYDGHVAVVEQINTDGTIVTSNSAWRGTYFWTATVSASGGYLESWMSSSRDYYCQGFIYPDNVPAAATWHAKARGAYSSDSSEALENAIMMASYLTSLGWSLNAVAGLLGNQAYESGYNPWRWEGDNVLAGTDTQLIAESMVHGYGLFQFTPAGKYINNSYAQGRPGYGPNFSDRTGNLLDGEAQLAYIDAGYGGYYSTTAYPLSLSEFKTSNQSPAYLASAWLYNYERPADPGATEAGRRSSAETWYQFLQGVPFGPPVYPWLLKWLQDKKRRRFK